MSTRAKRDHGGGLDAAISQFGGDCADWVDLSTGINPNPYPVGNISHSAWNTLPDSAANQALLSAARTFWNVPDQADILAAPGASSLIVRIPSLMVPGKVSIASPTYNEHAASFSMGGWSISDNASSVVLVHPNNPDGHFWNAPDSKNGLTIIDESFCDITPEKSLISLASRPRTIVLKSFGKFWGLAGLRLGFAIGDPEQIKQLADMLGPWPVSGPALSIGERALRDFEWANDTRMKLARDSIRLDEILGKKGLRLIGGTSLYRLYDTDDAAAMQSRFAKKRIWTRIFPYSKRWIRFGLPPSDRWTQVEDT